MKVILFGASGMVGAGVLLECLDDARIRSVLVVGRSVCGATHPKLTEILHGDFFDLSALRDRLSGADACFFCLGTSAAGLDERTYHHLTYDLTLAAARAVAEASPGLTFCYVSGEGTDSSEQGRAMWARVKGKTENALLRMPFKAAYMLRPAYIQPMRGVRSKTRWYQAVYTVFAPVYPILRRLLPRYVTTTAAVGKAMIRLAVGGFERPVLHSQDINRLAGEG